MVNIIKRLHIIYNIKNKIFLFITISLRIENDRKLDRLPIKCILYGLPYGLNKVVHKTIICEIH